MTMKRMWMVLGIGFVILLGCKKEAEPEGSLFVSGRIDGDTVDISSKIAGRIVDLKVREGDSVQAGDVVAWLSSLQEEAIRDAQKARIVSDQRTLDGLTR
jgi:HlyD family secretion protein